jgi:hypothetical protein
MKFRNGFVSNSSSSSFAIFGAILDYTEFESLMKAQNIEINDDDPECIYEALSKITEGTKLEYYIDEECNVAVGRSYNTLGDAETGAQFKADATTKVAKALGKEVECNTCIDSWYT